MSTNADQMLKMAMETMSSACDLEQKNKSLREELVENHKRLEEIELLLPRAQVLQERLKEKKEELAKKQKSLIEIQAAIIANLKSQEQERPAEALLIIPEVMSRVEECVTSLTERAMDQKTLAVPIKSILEVTDRIHDIYETLVRGRMIEETPEDAEQRRQANQMRQEITQRVKEIESRIEEKLANKMKEAEQNPERPPTPETEAAPAAEPAPAEQPAPQEAKPEEAKPEEAKPEEAKPEQAAAEEQK